MDNLYGRIAELCEIKKITIYRLCKDIGIRPSVLTDLKSGRKKGLSATTAQQIASYLDVSVEYLLGESDTKEKTATPKDDGLSEAEIELVKLFRVFSEDEKTRILEYVRTVLQIAEANRKLDALRIPGTNENLLK